MLLLLATDKALSVSLVKSTDIFQLPLQVNDFGNLIGPVHCANRASANSSLHWIMAVEYFATHKSGAHAHSLRFAAFRVTQRGDNAA